MTQSSFDDDINDARAQRFVRCIERFVDRYRERTGRHGQKVLADDNKRLDGRKIEQEPERFVEDALIAPVLECLGHDVRFRPKGFDGLEGRIPDFTLLNVDAVNFGEVKTPGSIYNARDETVQYLDMATGRPLIGIATDGFSWVLYTAGEDEEPVYTDHCTISKVIRRVNKEQSSKGSQRDRVELRKEALDFVDGFSSGVIHASLDTRR
jgi:predicted type IV restriction endonuclease